MHCHDRDEGLEPRLELHQKAGGGQTSVSGEILALLETQGHVYPT